jgi:hypothetical protein
MQTFLPFKDFSKSLKCLDQKRLNAQCKEAKQIIDTIELNKKGWSNHPAVNQWRGYTNCLRYYYNLSAALWNKCKKKDGTPVKQREFLDVNLDKITFPKWLGDERFHLSHRSNLLRKDYDHYSKFFQGEIDLPYFWPSKEEYK